MAWLTAKSYVHGWLTAKDSMAQLPEIDHQHITWRSTPPKWGSACPRFGWLLVSHAVSGLLHVARRYMDQCLEFEDTPNYQNHGALNCAEWCGCDCFLVVLTKSGIQHDFGEQHSILPEYYLSWQQWQWYVFFPAHRRSVAKISEQIGGSKRLPKMGFITSWPMVNHQASLTLVD